MGKAAEIGHGFEAVDWIESSDEDSACFAGKMRGDVEAVVHAVDEVDVGACPDGPKSIALLGVRPRAAWDAGSMRPR